MDLLLVGLVQRKCKQFKHLRCFTLSTSQSDSVRLSQRRRKEEHVLSSETEIRLFFFHVQLLLVNCQKYLFTYLENKYTFLMIY